MREILFRGKCKYTGEWFYGYYTLYAGAVGLQPAILTGTEKGCVIPVFVDPETVGQWTGLTDKNGTKIFEGDIVALLDDNEEIGIVDWDVDPAQFVISEPEGILGFDNYYEHDLEVIGNIHDNPELL